MAESLEKSLFGDDSDSEAELSIQQQSTTQTQSENNNNNTQTENNDDNNDDPTTTTTTTVTTTTTTIDALQSLFGEEEEEEEAVANTTSDTAIPSTPENEFEVQPKTAEDANLHAELFGEGDEELDEEGKPKKKVKGEDGIEEEDDEDIIREKQAIASKRKQEIVVARAEGEPLHIKVTRPPLPNNKSRLILFKLPNVLGIDSTPFDPETYEPQGINTDQDNNKSALDLSDSSFQKRQEKTRASQMMLENVIRYRIVKDSEGNNIRESNARVIEWSNGTKQLWIGNEVFEIHEREEDRFKNYLYATNQGRLAEEEHNNNNDMEDEDMEAAEDEPSLLYRSNSNPDQITLSARDKAKLKARIRASVGQISSYYNFAVTGIQSKSHMKLKTVVAEMQTKGPKILRQFEAVDYEKMKVEAEEQARQEELKKLRRQKKEEQARAFGATYKPKLDKDFLEEEDEEEAELHGNSTRKRRYDDEGQRRKLSRAKLEEEDEEDMDFIASEQEEEEGKQGEEDEEEAELHPTVKPRRSAAKPVKAESEEVPTTASNNNNNNSAAPSAPIVEDEEFVLKKTEKAKRRKLLEEDSE